MQLNDVSMQRKDARTADPMNGNLEELAQYFVHVSFELESDLCLIRTKLVGAEVGAGVDTSDKPKACEETESVRGMLSHAARRLRDAKQIGESLREVVGAV